MLHEAGLDGEEVALRDQGLKQGVDAPNSENGVVVLVPRYGIEGIVYVADKGASSSAFVYDAKKDVLRAPGCVLRTFDKVTVKIAVDASKPHRPKLELSIVKPVLPK